MWGLGGLTFGLLTTVLALLIFSTIIVGCGNCLGGSATH